MIEARALLDPWCEAELVLSTSFATQCGLHSQVDEETLKEFADGTRVPSMCYGAEHPRDGFYTLGILVCI
jgi:hypothetical protein